MGTDNQPTTCGTCGGKGFLNDYKGHFDGSANPKFTYDCPTCHGSGVVQGGKPTVTAKKFAEITEQLPDHTYKTEYTATTPTPAEIERKQIKSMLDDWNDALEDSPYYYAEAWDDLVGRIQAREQAARAAGAREVLEELLQYQVPVLDKTYVNSESIKLRLELATAQLDKQEPTDGE